MEQGEREAAKTLTKSLLAQATATNVEAGYGKACFHCGKPATKRCSRCRGVHFCGAQCQRDGWVAHKTDCKPCAEPAPGDTALRLHVHPPAIEPKANTAPATATWRGRSFTETFTEAEGLVLSLLREAAAQCPSLVAMLDDELQRWARGEGTQLLRSNQHVYVIMYHM